MIVEGKWMTLSGGFTLVYRGVQLGAQDGNSTRLAIAGGVTTQILPGSANNIGGQAFLIRLRPTPEGSASSKKSKPPEMLHYPNAFVRLHPLETHEQLPCFNYIGEGSDCCNRHSRPIFCPQC
ncbi:hypothetical protein M378DRAFT_330239 [Amanita muscaria Koide BX008]|uniref:Uncharacterized protein n=1 Tax=Amanita muscaria (strain Koide BX008) TaxID=946122 RepID=A0A0C2SUP0_AMAMK|nr:hypothetical protein M378DRAFT_330239 [Amanita muscaria Koide BX008]